MNILQSHTISEVSVSFISEHGKFWFAKASITAEHKSVKNVDCFLKFEKICKVAKSPESYCFSEKVSQCLIDMLV